MSQLNYNALLLHGGAFSKNGEIGLVQLQEK